MIILGLMVIFQGILLCLDTLLWLRAAGPDYIGYSIYEAEIRMQTYQIEIGVSILITLIGAVFLILGIVKRGGFRGMKCPVCGHAVQKRQHFCGECGGTLAESVHSGD